MKFLLLSLLTFCLIISSVFSAISINPNTLSVDMYGGETKDINFQVCANNNDTALVYLHYTTSLSDENGLTINTTNPFTLGKNGCTLTPLSITLANNFKPEVFDLNLYVDSNFEEYVTPSTPSPVGGGGGGSWGGYTPKPIQDKNVIVTPDKNKPIVKPIEEPIIKPIDNKPVIDANHLVPTKNIEQPTFASAMFGLIKENFNFLLIGLLALLALVVVGYIIFTSNEASKKQEVK